jgi:4-diphosphocytidyl-2-C-methyl-D-erythritol kinase
MELLKSPAKINLFLDILSKDIDGYHNINSIITLIDLNDEIKVKESKSLDINFSGEFSKDINQNNILMLFEYLLKKGYLNSDKYFIDIAKNIPVGAGLGGGSSNIATILKYLSSKNLIEYKNVLITARELGSDIEFFFDESPAIIVGKGSIHQRIKAFKKLHILLVYPNFILSTQKAYEMNSRFDDKSSFSLDQEVYDFDSIMKSSSNSLQDAAVKLCPDIKIIIDELSSRDGSLYSRMTGSGSCCFAVFNEKDLAQEALNILKSNHSDWWFHLSRII